MRTGWFRRAAVGIAVLALAGASGCSSRRPVPPPPPVSLTLVPKGLLGGQVGFYLNTAPQTLAAFTQDPGNSLISSGRLWELRSNQARLVATLEIAAVKPNVDLTRSSVRAEFTDPILIGAVSDFRLAGQEVEAVISSDTLSTFVWFGKGLFEVLQVKDAPVSPPNLAEAIIRYQQSVPAWQPLLQLYLG